MEAEVPCDCDRQETIGEHRSGEVGCRDYCPEPEKIPDVVEAAPLPVLQVFNLRVAPRPKMEISLAMEEDAMFIRECWLSHNPNCRCSASKALMLAGAIVGAARKV